ncbi:MAG TPA: hypothetical protein VFR14_12140 [Candidatus Limnocylindrales bacterium]|nr:hypothetical protein [Candidatus Limnocylindrales bacterium]
MEPPAMTRKQGGHARDAQSARSPRRFNESGPTSGAGDDIDHRRLAGDIGAFESANGLPHDVVAVGLVAMAVVAIHTVIAGAKAIIGRRPRR